MSIVQRKSEAHLLASLEPGENVLRTVQGIDGRREIFMAITNRRMWIYEMGTTKLSQPNLRQVRLRDVTAVDCQRAPFGSYHMGRPVLTIDSRAGSFQFVVTGNSKKTAAEIPNLILDAQDADAG